MIKISDQQKRLIEAENIALATVNSNGRPNVIAVACCKVVGDDKILITDNFMNKTRKNLLENGKIALAVWSKDGEEGYQFKGTAAYFTSGEWKKMVDLMPDNKGLAHKAAVLVAVEEVWNLISPKLLAAK